MGYHIIMFEKNISNGSPFYNPNDRNAKVIDNRFKTFGTTISEVVRDLLIFNIDCQLKELEGQIDDNTDHLDPLLFSEDFQASVDGLLRVFTNESFNATIVHSYTENESMIISDAIRMSKRLDGLAGRFREFDYPLGEDCGEWRDKLDRRLHETLIALGDPIEERIPKLRTQLACAEIWMVGKKI